MKIRTSCLILLVESGKCGRYLLLFVLSSPATKMITLLETLLVTSKEILTQCTHLQKRIWTEIILSHIWLNLWMKPDETLANTGINKAASWGPRTMELFPLKSVQSNDEVPDEVRKVSSSMCGAPWATVVSAVMSNQSVGLFGGELVGSVFLFWVWLFFLGGGWFEFESWFSVKQSGLVHLVFMTVQKNAGRCSTAIRVEVRRLFRNRTASK